MTKKNGHDMMKVFPSHFCQTRSSAEWYLYCCKLHLCQDSAVFAHECFQDVAWFLKCLIIRGVTVARNDYFQYFVYMHRICPAEQGPFCVKASFEKPVIS